jgi:hypothetical protein
MLGEWILTAWVKISSQSIVAGFKKWCIANALDGTEDNVLWQDVEDENHERDSEEEKEDNGEEQSENENFQ